MRKIISFALMALIGIFKVNSADGLTKRSDPPDVTSSEAPEFKRLRIAELCEGVPPATHPDSTSEDSSSAALERPKSWDLGMGAFDYIVQLSKGEHKRLTAIINESIGREKFGLITERVRGCMENILPMLDITYRFENLILERLEKSGLVISELAGIQSELYPPLPDSFALFQTPGVLTRSYNIRVIQQMEEALTADSSFQNYKQLADNLLKCTELMAKIAAFDVVEEEDKRLRITEHLKREESHLIKGKHDE